MVLVSEQMLSKVQERCQEETLELVNRTTTEEEARWKDFNFLRLHKYLEDTRWLDDDKMHLCSNVFKIFPSVKRYRALGAEEEARLRAQYEEQGKEEEKKVWRE